MTAFTEALEAERTTGGRRSVVDVVLEEVDDPTRQDIERALHDETVAHSVLARALERIGHPVSESSVKRWRRQHV